MKNNAYECLVDTNIKVGPKIGGRSVISVSVFRNSIAHANWTTLTKEGFVRTDMKVDKKDGYVKFQMEKITPKIIRNKIKELDKLIIKILKIQELISGI